MIDVISSALLVLSAFFMLVAALGLVRFPDLLLRMHAATKASGMALALCLAAIILRHPSGEFLGKGALALLFAFATLPVAAHLLGRNASGVDGSEDP